jgi:hypothetical protein
MLTTDSINPSVKIFNFLITASIISRKILVKHVTINASVYIQPMASIRRSKIGFPRPHFSK